MMKTIQGKCSYTANLDKMKPESREKYENGIDFFFNTKEDIKVGDVIKIHRMKRYGYFHVENVLDEVYYFKHKTAPELRQTINEGDAKNYYPMNELVFGDPSHIHCHKIEVEKDK